MVNTILKNFIINYLQYEYTRYSNIFIKYSEHIERCYNEFIININVRNQYIKNLSDLIKLTNNIYNDKIKSLKSVEIYNQELNNNKNLIKLLDDNSNVLFNLIDIYNALDIDNFNGININIFSDIKTKLLQLSNTIGFYNIDIALELLIGNKYKNIINTNDNIKFNNKLDILTKTFIPLSFKLNNLDSNILNDKLNLNSKITCKNKITTDYEILLNNFFEVVINIPHKNYIIIFNGYFTLDPINILIKTSQICEQYLYNKKNKLIDFITKGLRNVNEKFKLEYIKNLNIGEILGFKKKELSAKLKNDYDKYTYLSSLSFKKLMQEFLNDNITITNQYNIIKLFLIGNTEVNNNNAGLLIGLTKDKKYGSEIIYNIIYKNLNYTLQVKLNKSTISIKNELDKLKYMTSDDVDLKKQIVLCKNMPNYVKKLAIDKIEEMKSGGTEYYKQKTYLDIILNFPWINDMNDNNNDIFKIIGSDIVESKKFLDKLKNTLDNKVYGHTDCKLAMQELIGLWLNNPKSSGKAIGLMGPPGVGKTMIAKSLGDALSLPFAHINLGGMDDRCILSGHSYTYSGAQPGLIIRKMVEAGKSRCILYFDELDKTCTKHNINEIYNVLIHVTDPNTNTQYSDAFFNEITFRLDQVLFVFSYNDADKIDKILLDRMEQIKVKPYTTTDKVVIFKDFLIKEVSNNIGVKSNYITFNDDDIEYIIENYTFEAGVRELKRKLETIFYKINLDRIYKRNIFENSSPTNIIINRDMINLYLNKPNLNIKTIHSFDSVGIINGLYATKNGSGGIIPILIYNNYVGEKNNFVLKITGSQGKIMKESVSFAYTIAMNLIKKEFRQSFLDNNPYGLHIHTPDGATPKDGPSAGSAFTTAFISVILNKKIKNNIAMTGEIELNGNITAIGGLEYKLKGAQKAGVKIVFIPNENKKDLDVILKNDNSLNADLQIHLVNHIYDVLKIALIDNINNSNSQLFDPYLYFNNVL